MRILFLSPYVPFPVRNGGHNRTASLIRGLTRLGSVHVMAIGRATVSAEKIERRMHVRISRARKSRAKWPPPGRFKRRERRLPKPRKN